MEDMYKMKILGYYECLLEIGIKNIALDNGNLIVTDEHIDNTQLNKLVDMGFEYRYNEFVLEIYVF